MYNRCVKLKLPQCPSCHFTQLNLFFSANEEISCWVDEYSPVVKRLCQSDDDFKKTYLMYVRTHSNSKYLFYFSATVRLMFPEKYKLIEHLVPLL